MEKERIANIFLAGFLAVPMMTGCGRQPADTDCYSLWGGSAGARMAAYLGSYGLSAFGGDELPGPGTVAEGRIEDAVAFWKNICRRSFYNCGCHMIDTAQA